jgi:chitinase
MAMDYGDWAAPNPDGQMGQYAIDAADSLFGKLQTIYPDKSDNELWAMVGVTPMIGQNDVISEVFYLSDAQQLLTYAQQRNIGMLSMWSLSRDNGSAGICNHASPTYSCLEQESFAFTNILKAFNQ